MTPYERGFLDCRERAAKVCEEYAETRTIHNCTIPATHSSAALSIGNRILSLTTEAPDSQPEGVIVPQGLFDDLHDFLEGKQDVIDGADGPRPNRAMTLLRELKDVENAMIADAKEERDAQG